MKISSDSYKRLVDLLNRIEVGSSIAGKEKADLDLVRASTKVREYGAEVYGGTEVRAALKRLIKGQWSIYEKTKPDGSIGSSKKTLPASAKGEASLEIYRRSPTLRGIKQKIISDDRLLARFLLARRDMIAAENLMATGKIESPVSPYPDLQNHFSLTALVDALIEAGRIPTHEEQARIKTKVAAPLDYFLENRKTMEPRIRMMMELMLAGQVPEIIRWFLGEPNISTNSILFGDQIAFMVISNHRELLEMAPAGINDQFESAAWKAPHDATGARRMAVEALKDLLEYLEITQRHGMSLSESQSAWVSWLKTVLEWNIDALQTKKPGAGEDGGKGGGGDAPSAQGSGGKPKRLGGIVRNGNSATASGTGEGQGLPLEGPASTDPGHIAAAAALTGANLFVCREANAVGR